MQFGITIDDDAIRRAVIEKVSNQVTSSIKGDIIKEISGRKDASKFDYTRKLHDMVSESTEYFLEANKEEIIKETSKQLADKLSRTKAVKEMVNRTLNQLLDEGE